MTALYNEIDEYAAQWLRNLIAAGHIAPGVVDTRSVEDLPPDYVSRFTQVHLFAGIGVWSYAARLAGISDDRPLWTLSCPCQPFSAAGKGGGFADERHLWPAAFHLIEQCRPRRLYGEQVADRGGLAWLDLVQADMEGTDYAFGAVDTCSAGFGAPHRRQRLRFAAMDNARLKGLEGHARNGRGVVGWPSTARPVTEASPFGGVGHADGGGPDPSAVQRPRPTNGFWRFVDWLHCRDHKWRPVEPGTFPLFDGSADRMGRVRADQGHRQGRLKGYGNAVDAQATKAFIEATL